MLVLASRVVQATTQSPFIARRAFRPSHPVLMAKKRKRDSPAVGGQFWLLKSEPDDYSIDMLQRDGFTCWDGVRNVVARKNLRAMLQGDSCLFYHSSCGKNVGVVGTCTVKRTAYPDPADAKWAVVDVEFGAKFSQPLLLPALKAEQDGRLSGMALFRQPRLSVQPVSADHYNEILRMVEE